MSVNTKKLEALLKWYNKSVGSPLKFALIVNRDGLTIDAFARGSDTKAIEGDVSELVKPVLSRIKNEFKEGTFGTRTFDTDEYRFIFCEAGPESIFVTVLDSNVNIDHIIPYAYLTTEKIIRIFDGRVVSPVIPKIIVEKSSQKIERKVDKLQKVKFESSEYAYKLILGGDGGVGKTSMVHRFVEESFETDYKMTIGTSIMKKECEFEGLDSKVRFVIWDLAGQTQFKKVRKSFLQNAETGILVFDVTNKESISGIEKWHEEFTDAVPGIILILVGNKVDLKDQRVVATSEGEEMASKLGVSYMETSALTGENITDAFKMLALQIIKKFVISEVV